MRGYQDYYEWAIERHTVGLKLVVGGTGLGKTSGIRSVVRDLAPERKAICIVNLLS